jgi:hypothetical protein
MLRNVIFDELGGADEHAASASTNGSHARNHIRPLPPPLTSDRRSGAVLPISRAWRKGEAAAAVDLAHWAPSGNGCRSDISIN